MGIGILLGLLLFTLLIARIDPTGLLLAFVLGVDLVVFGGLTVAMFGFTLLSLSRRLFGWIPTVSPPSSSAGS